MQASDRDVIALTNDNRILIIHIYLISLIVQFNPHPRIRPSSSTSTAPCYYLTKADVLKENKAKASTSSGAIASTSKGTSTYRKIDRHRLIRNKMESQQVPSKRSKVLSSVKPPKSDDGRATNSLVEILIADATHDLKPLDKGTKSLLKVPLALQRRNSFNGITRKDLLAQPSTSSAAASFDSEPNVAHNSGQIPFTVANPMKSKSNISSFRRRKSKRLSEARTTNVSKGQSIKTKNATLLKKRGV